MESDNSTVKTSVTAKAYIENTATRHNTDVNLCITLSNVL